jgi:hypothetical protein
MCGFMRALAVMATTLLAVGCSQPERPLHPASRPVAVSRSTSPRPAAISVATATSPDLSGVYSSVRYAEEAGDDLGMEIEIITKPRPIAVVTICEGQCWGGKTWPVVIDGRDISFSVEEAFNDQNGKPVKPRILEFAGRLEGDVLVVDMPGASDVPEERLKRVAHPAPGQTARLGCMAGC